MPYQVLMSYYRCAIPIETIKSRLKNPEAILEKINRKSHPFSVESIEENIFDVAGVRVICSFPKDIYMLADLLLKQDDVVLMEKRDYTKIPKISGYLRGKDLSMCLKTGNACGALSVTAYGGNTAFPDRDQLDTFLSERGITLQDE